MTDEDYFSEEMRSRDKTLIETFGFGYSQDFKERIVVALIRYLSRLSPEHQQLWKSKELVGNYSVHPNYEQAELLGAFPDGVSIFNAFLEEIKQINILSNLTGRSALFRKEFDHQKRPRKFGFLLRPTLSEYRDFVVTLDKIVSENINQDFFGNDVDLYKDITKKNGTFERQRKGSISILEEWLVKFFKPNDPTRLKKMIETFRKIRHERQPGAHKLELDEWSIDFFATQRKLMDESYDALKTLRLVFSAHPQAHSYKPPEWLQTGKIWSY